MHVLERLYDVAESRLARDLPDWEGFAADFQSVFGAHMVLYRPRYEPDGVTWCGFEVISTSRPALLEAYEREQIFRHHVMSEPDMAPLEPLRRTDQFPDEVFRNLGRISEFLISNGMFYLMMVPSLLADGRYFCLYVWRSAEEPDFSDLEKQRLALLMRYLLAMIDGRKLAIGPAADAVTLFGDRHGLTPTEVEILSALLNGMSLREIADASGRSYGTVRWHVQNTLSKCQVSSQRDLLREFYGLITN